MRCPKCHYISFDGGERCRNCGYDFSLTVDVAGPELSMTTPGAPEGPLGDFALEAARAQVPRAPDTASDLPLFARGGSDRTAGGARLAAAEPAVAPRPPLAVRRSSPAPARERLRAVDEPTLDLGSPEPLISGRRNRSLVAIEPPVAPEAEPASIVRRMLGGMIDVVLVASIHAAVVYLTLRLCGLTVADLRLLPPAPLSAFLLMLTGGYLIAFTVAGGQTIGKMAAGVRVVPTEERDPGNARVTLGSAVLRAVGCLISVLTVGLGYLPALFGKDHRALHDRLADTRVVRA
jgi:uncharacterized RDD family membrane protein YckC